MKKFFIPLVIASSAAAAAQPANLPTMYGKNNPLFLDDLPIDSRLRKQLESLPIQANERALAWLNSFDFPEADLEVLAVDDEGGIFYQDTHKPKPITGATSSTSITTASTLPLVDAFKLHSKPNSTKKVFLDFDGHTISSTAWNSTVSSYSARAFDTDGYPSSFNDAERAVIHEVWHRIAEDYAPFDIDVTTEEPTSFTSTTGRILFTQDVDSKGIAMPSKGSGGVAYVNVFGINNYAYYSPALVYVNKMGPNQPNYMAEAAAHEFGHNLGLSHDGIGTGGSNPNCSTQTAYFCGMGSGYVSWGPIMGVSYYVNVT
ncbi:MAG: hypothetical protein RL563_491, partial [Pseudomonadota bacterium]